MWHLEDNFRIILGGNTFINVPNLVVYKRQPLFVVKRSANSDLLGIDFDVFDKDGNRVATVRGGVVVQGNENDYEIYKGMDRYTVTEKKTGRIVCDIRKRSESPNAELEVSVELYTPDGFLFNATPTGININTNIFSGNIFRGVAAAFVIEDGGKGIRVGVGRY